MDTRSSLKMTLLLLSLAGLLFSGCFGGRREVISTKVVSLEPQPTAAGPRMVEVVRASRAYLETIERCPNVKSVEQVTNNQDGKMQIGAPVLSPVADLLVYTMYSWDGEESNIWMQSIGSHAKTRVTFGHYLDQTPCFTTDGQYLLFSSNRASAAQSLWRVRLQGGGGLTKVTDPMGLDVAPSATPDGSRIVHQSLPVMSTDHQIWSVDATGILPTQLREGEAPQVSPDGTQIVFMRKEPVSEAYQLWLMNIDGSGETQLTQNATYDAADPRWSPDGKWIAFASNEGFDSKHRQNFDIWLIAPDGSKKTQLTTNGSQDDLPCWDYTGEHIYFRSNRGSEVQNIWRLTPAVSPADAIVIRPH